MYANYAYVYVTMCHSESGMGTDIYTHPQPSPEL